MLHRLILKVTKFQLPPPKRLGTVVKDILGGHHALSIGLTRHFAQTVGRGNVINLLSEITFGSSTVW